MEIIFEIFNLRMFGLYPVIWILVQLPSLWMAQKEMDRGSSVPEDHASFEPVPLSLTIWKHFISLLICTGLAAAFGGG